jgi:UDP-N-acetylglucosamine 2-epimerase (non-hydrolysing)
MRLVVVYGTRPEVVKLAPVIKEAKKKGIETIQIWSGQHLDLAFPFIEWFELHPDICLDLMTDNQKPVIFISMLMKKFTPILERETPDWVIVQGDTASTFAAGLTGFLHGSNVGYVESGLRTWKLSQPYPEEALRCMLSQIARLHFAPTPLASENLQKSGVERASIKVTGNTVIDALFWSIKKIDSGNKPELSTLLPELKNGSNLILITGHRRESFGSGIQSICSAIKEASMRHPDYIWIYPVHFNPHVYKPVHKILQGQKNVKLLDPVPYPVFVELMRRSSLIITDSGGIQEEAPSLGVPVLVTRETTERPEAMETGNVCLVGTERESIVEGIDRLIDPKRNVKTKPQKNPFGDGKASQRIIDSLLDHANG